MSKRDVVPSNQSLTNLSRAEALWRSSVLKVDAQRIDLDLTDAQDLSTPEFKVVSTLQLTITQEQPVAGVWVDFLGESVDSVLVDDSPAEVDWNTARVYLPQLAPGAHTIVLSAHGRFSNSGQGLHRFHDPVDDTVYLYTHFEPSDARRAWPCMDQPDLKTSFSLSVVHPSAWTLLANGEVVECESITAGTARTCFSTTKKLPTYLSALAAGPWYRVRGEWTSPRGDVVPLSWSCRSSLQEHLDAEELLDITRKGLDLFDETYTFPYPWGTYDSVLVPEYNIGAMENPGCVTFNEDLYLFQGTATRAQHESRANTILHEMCHMWFGDLVTPQWWEDTWLKESFADHEGTWAAAEAAGFSESWVSFAARRKSWAYLEDLRVDTTHPIVATVDDVEAARQAFDGITYAKGASVLKQLVAYTGRDIFTQAARSWFKQRAFDNGTLTQFMEVLSQASGRDMEGWAQAWLHTSGPTYLSNELLLTDDPVPVITRLSVSQDSIDLSTGKRITRPHSLSVGLYSHDDSGMLRRTHSFPVRLDTECVEIPQAVGLPAPEMVLVNDADQTYAIVRPDARSLTAVTSSLSDIADPLARAMWWSILHNLLRDALLPAPVFIQTVLEHADDGTEPSTLETLLRQALSAALLYTPAQQRVQVLQHLAHTQWDLLQQSTPGADSQLLRVRAWLQTAANTLGCDREVQTLCAKRIRLILSGKLAGLELSNDLRWRALNALACLGTCNEEELDSQLKRDPSATGQVRYLEASMSVPKQAVKQSVRRRLYEDLSLSNDQIDALTTAYAVTSQQELILPYTEDYFQNLEEIWATRGQEIATRLVLGMFPSAGGSAESAAALAWLDTHPQAPEALRRLILKLRSDLERCLRVQAISEV